MEAVGKKDTAEKPLSQKPKGAAASPGLMYSVHSMNSLGGGGLAEVKPRIKREVCVSIMEAKGLPESANPYCVLHCNGTKLRTPTAYKTAAHFGVRRTNGTCVSLCHFEYAKFTEQRPQITVSIWSEYQKSKEKLHKSTLLGCSLLAPRQSIFPPPGTQVEHWIPIFDFPLPKETVLPIGDLVLQIVYSPVAGAALQTIPCFGTDLGYRELLSSLCCPCPVCHTLDYLTET